MRREIKLIILVFILVVGPAIAVSFLAARVLGSWQIVLQKRMEMDAARVLEQVSLAWEKEKAALAAWGEGDAAVRYTPRRMAALRLEHPWIDGTLVYESEAGVIYPAGEPQAAAWVVSPPVSVVRGGTLLVLPTGTAECRRLLEQPALAPAAKAEILLRLAGLEREAGETNRAVASLKQVVELNPSAPPHDPVEGFYYDLIALKQLSTSGQPAASEELLSRVLARYDDLAPLQRDLMVEWIESQKSEARGQESGQNGVPVVTGVSPVGLWGDKDAAGTAATTRNKAPVVTGVPPVGSQGGRGEREVIALLEWRERMRGRMLTPELRGEIAQELSGLSTTIPEAGWVRGRVLGHDTLVLKRGRPGRESSSILLAIEFDVTRLIPALNTLFSGIATNSGIRVECAPATTQSNGLASRRLSPPLDSLILTATPSDPKAFSLNARLQSRLYRWSGLLLMTSIVAGVWLVWRQAAAEIRQARERSDFAATVSHDLRTPLSSMRMLAESLYMGNVHEESKKQKFLGAIIKESDRLSRLTDRALYFIRYGQDTLRYRFTEGDLGVLVRNVVEVFAIGVKGEIKEAGGREAPVVTAVSAVCAQGDKDAADTSLRQGYVGQAAATTKESEAPRGSSLQSLPPVHITLSISPELPQVQFDGGAMEQVVFNLLDNAVKYSDKDKGVRIEVSLEPARPSAWLRAGGVWARRAKLAGPEVMLAVRDHGAGMSPEDVKRILKPYARGRGAAQRNARGIGLGLALCHHVVKAHGGRIQIESVPGQGSVFRVIMPVG